MRHAIWDETSPLPEEQDIPTLPANQKRFIETRTNRLAARLESQLRAHNPAYTLVTTLVPESLSLRFHVKVGTPRLEPRNVALIEGDLGLLWGHENGRGKALTFAGRVYVANSGIAGFGPHDMRRDSAIGNDLFATLVKLGLPKGTEKRVMPAWKQAQGMTYRPGVYKTPEDTSAARAFRDADTKETREAVFSEVASWERNFRNRYVIRNPIFRNADFHYDAEKGRLSLKLIATRGCNVGNPKLCLEGPVSVQWLGTGKVRLKFMPDKGLDITPAPISFAGHKIRGDASMTIIGLLMEAGAIRDANTLFGENGFQRPSDHFNEKAVREKGPTGRREKGFSVGRRDIPRRDSHAQFRHLVRTGYYPE